MILTWNGCRFELNCSGENYEQAKALGFHWDYQKKRAWTGRIDIAQKFLAFADHSAMTRFLQEKQQIELSKATDSNADIPCPEGLSYLGFQKAGISFALQRRNTLIADEMGLGKTIQAVGVINGHPAIKRILVICPASLKINWSRELMKWTVKKLSGGFAYEKTFPDTDIVIINYDIVKRFREVIDSRLWDLAIFDEAHYLKNPESIRTQFCLGRDSTKKPLKPIDAGMRLFLTGTPILNRPVELWPIVRVGDPAGLGGSHWSYVRRYCKAWKAPWGWDFTGSSNTEELQTRLRSSIMIRRLKKDVLTNLPPKRRQVIAIEQDKAKSAVQHELQFFEKNQKEIEEALKEMKEEQQGDEESFKNAVTKLKGAKQGMFEQLSVLRHQTAIAMLPYAIKYIEDMLEQEEKIIVFAHHRDVVEAIANAFKNISVFMHGGIKHEERQAIVDLFQQGDKYRIIVGSVGTMGVGWTLTRAAYALFVEGSWVPADISQAEDRAHRIGQLESLLIQHLVFDGSLGATMMQRVVEKQEMIDKAVG